MIPYKMSGLDLIATAAAQWRGDLWCPLCYSGDKKRLCHRIPRASREPGPTYLSPWHKEKGISNGMTKHFHESTFNRHLTEDHEFKPTGGTKNGREKGGGRGSKAGGNPGYKGGYPAERGRPSPKVKTEKRWRFKFRRGWRLQDARLRGRA